MVNGASKKETAEYLIIKGADVHAKDCNNSTILHFAAFNGWKDVV